MLSASSERSQQLSGIYALPQGLPCAALLYEIHASLSPGPPPGMREAKAWRRTVGEGQLHDEDMRTRRGCVSCVPLSLSCAVPAAAVLGFHPFSIIETRSSCKKSAVMRAAECLVWSVSHSTHSRCRSVRARTYM